MIYVTACHQLQHYTLMQSLFVYFSHTISIITAEILYADVKIVDFYTLTPLIQYFLLFLSPCVGNAIVYYLCLAPSLHSSIQLLYLLTLLFSLHQWTCSLFQPIQYFLRNVRSILVEFYHCALYLGGTLWETNTLCTHFLIEFVIKCHTCTSQCRLTVWLCIKTRFLLLPRTLAN